MFCEDEDASVFSTCSAQPFVPVRSQVGLFRKSGVKSRIQALRQQCERTPDSVNYEDQSAYDVADMVKQFFRDLPEPLLTSKLGETFLHIYQCKTQRPPPVAVNITSFQKALPEPPYHGEGV